MRLFSLIVCLLTCSMFAQAQDGKTVRQGFTYKLLGVDYTSPLTQDYTIDPDKVVRGAELGYNRYLSPSFDLSVPFRFAANAPLGRKSVYSLDATAKYKLANGYIFKETAIFQPFLVGGLGVNYIPELETTTSLHLPLGAGLNIRLTENFFVQGQAEYRLLGDEHIAYTGGVSVMLGEMMKKEEVIEEIIEVAPVDTDGDGINDENDSCPKVAGLAKFAGCPDTDKDGVQDSKDECPEVAGTIAFKGCPDTDGDGVQDSKDKCPKVVGLVELDGCPDSDDDKDGVPNRTDKCPTVAGSATTSGCPDTDNDGVIDSKDKCPKVAGTAAFNGCPDTDKDGVADNLDKCPTQAGTKANGGCPEIKKEEKERLNMLVKGIQFETGKSIIKTSSYNTLDEAVSILNKYSGYFVSIEGHTDNVGNDANNMRLSESRAKACYDYLIKKGVSSSRMSYKGYGETQPKTPNNTPAGRAENRRVELKLIPIK
ncbi:MAG: thrombospondin type 3 repeat-containing protein [Saprospiraceae bacterium]